MYVSLLGKPSDKDQDRYPAVYLTGPHEWVPSVLDYAYPSEDGELTWSTDHNDWFDLDPNFDEFGNFTLRGIQTLNILND